MATMRTFAASPTLFMFQMLLLTVSLRGVANNPLYPTEDTATIALEIFRRQNLWQSTLFVCDQTHGVQFLRLLGKTTQTSVISNEIDSESKLRSARARLGAVALFDNGCDKKSKSSPLLTLKTFQNHRNSTYRWLLFSDSLENIRSYFSQTKIELDTSLTAVVPDEKNSLNRNFFDFYWKDENFLSTHRVGHWQNKSMKNWLDAENARHRKNMYKQHISYGLTVTRHKSWDNAKMMEILDLPPDDPKLPDINCQLTPYYVLRITREMFNYTLKGVNGYKSPGYPNPNGTFSDLLGAIQTGEINCSASNFIVIGHRQKIVKFLGLCWYFRNTLVYLSSNTFSTPTALLKPFSTGIWILLGIYSVLCITMLTVLLIIDNNRRGGDSREVSASKSSLIVFGSVGGQGEPTNSSSTSSSVLLLTMLLFGVVLSCVYSAEIVQFLLAEPSPTYPKTNDLLRSPLKVAAHDFFYYRKTVFGPNTLEVYRKIYDEKMVYPGGFKALQPAVDGLLQGKWAYFVPEPILYLMLRTATSQQKCRMFEIPDIPKFEKPLCPMIHRDSPATNMLNRGHYTSTTSVVKRVVLLTLNPLYQYAMINTSAIAYVAAVITLTLLRERGFYSRYARLWFAPKPSCTEGGARQWGAVALKVLYPAIGLVFCGLLASNLLLLLEIFYFRQECYRRKTNPRNYRTCLIRPA